MIGFLSLFFIVFAMFPEEDHVWVLDSISLPSALKVQEKLLVEFFAPWCDHCKQFSPEYSKAAEGLKKHKIHIGKVDGSENRDLVDRYNITGYPSLLFFIDRVPTEYTGIRTSDGVFDWVLKRQKKTIKNFSEFDANNGKISAVYFGEVSDSERGIFEFASVNVEEIDYYETNLISDSEKFGVKRPGIMVFKDEKKILYELAFSTLDLAKFLEKLKPGKLHKFNEETIKLIFDYQSPTFFFLRKEIEKDLYQGVMESLAEAYNELFIFTCVDLNGTGNSEKLAYALGITPEEQPMAVIVDFQDAFNKYKSISRTFSELSSFIAQYKARTLTPYFKSEPSPVPEFENYIKILTGNSYLSEISDPNTDALVLYYTNDHPKCKEFLPIYEKLGKETKKWENFIPMKFNLDRNEADGLKIKMIPHLRLFPKGEKEGIIYQGEFTKVAIKGFLREHIRKENLDL